MSQLPHLRAAVESISNDYINDPILQSTWFMRQLTFLDIDDAYNYSQDNVVTTDEIPFVVGFSVLAAGFVFLAILVVYLAWTCQELYEWNAVRLAMPAISLVMCLESATLAFDEAKATVPSQWAIAVYMLETTIAPGIFLSTFVITFLSYRTRSMPFCFVYRGMGRQATGEPYQDEDEEIVQPLVRPAVLIVACRLFSVGLLILALIVNFDVLWSQDDLAGRTGWVTLIQDPSNQSVDHIILSLLPMALVSIVCLYFSLLLWRYGCEFSMVIYPSIINPWMYPLLGSACMIAGQMFGPILFPILSNVGIFIFMASMVRTLYEVRFDMQQAGDLGQFLSALGNDTVTNTVSGVEKATNVDTISTGRFGGVNSDGDGALSSTILGSGASVSFVPTTSSTSTLPATNVAEDDDDEEHEQIPSVRPATLHSTRAAQTPYFDETESEATAAPGEEEAEKAKFAAQRVAGIAKRPPKLKAGEKPTGTYVVY